VVFSRSVYHGWVIVALAALSFMLVIGITSSGFGLFVLPVSSEYGLSRANMNTAFILVNIGSALFAPFVGRLIDRYPARPVMIVSSLLFGLALVGLGLTRSLWVSVLLLAIVLPIAIDGASLIAMSALVARWFNARRGLAISVSVIGVSLGGVIVTPLVAMLIAGSGWRTTLVVCGVAASALLLFSALLVRDRPAPGEVEAGEGQPVHPAVSSVLPRADAPQGIITILRMPKFWFIGLGAGLASGIGASIFMSIVPFAMARGLDLASATLLVSVTSATSVAGKLLLAPFADRVNKLWALVAIVALTAPMNLVLLASHGTMPMLVSIAILGLASGALPAVLYALLADMFGIASYGTVRGLFSPMQALFVASGLRFAGEVYDRTGSYDLMFMVFLVLQFVSAALILMVLWCRR